MKNFVVVLVLAASLLAESTATKKTQVTGVAGESWLSHLHRPLEQTSMGKTGRLGPPTWADSRETVGVSPDTRQKVTLHGSDLYRLNCQGCHGEAGLGAPPEINSVINPTRSTSAPLIMDLMKKRDMDMPRAQAAELANESRAALLQRLHNGGTDMPPFPQLSDTEVRAIFAYLRQLAEVPGAEKQQVTVEETPVRVGEHIVKSTCHICHSAAGPNPSPDQLFDGAIPPLSTLTARTTLPEFARKVRSGAPIVMGTPAQPFRGRMPVFYYLSDSEVADAYLYLSLYPPYKFAVLDPARPAPPMMQASSRLTSLVVDSEPSNAIPARAAAEMRVVAVPLIAEIFVALLLAGGMGYTLLEIKRLTAKNQRSKLALIEGMTNQQAAGGDVVVAFSSQDDPVASSPLLPVDHHRFESSWLARRLEKEDWVA